MRMTVILSVLLASALGGGFALALGASSPHRACAGAAQLAYGDAGISLIDADGHRRKLTDGRFDAPVRWSADGSRLLFRRARTMDEDSGPYYTVRADGTGLRRARRPAAGFESSPDGRRRASLAHDQMEGDELGLVVDGRELASGLVGGFAWSPDGTRIAYDWNASNVSVVDVTTGVITPLTHLPMFDRFSAVDAPAVAGWSPDGRRVTLTGPGGDVYVVDAAGGPLRRLTRFDVASDAPGASDFGFSPDGRWIGVARWDPMNSKGSLFLIRPDGTGLRWLAPIDPAMAAAWRPCTR